MRASFKLKLTNQSCRVIYKLFHDLLFLILIFFSGTIISEGILPGIISSHIGLYNIIIAIAINLSAITIIQKKFPQFIPLSNTVGISRGKTFWILIFILFALILNSLIKLNLFLIPLFTSLIAASIYFSYKIIFEEAKK